MALKVISNLFSAQCLVDMYFSILLIMLYRAIKALIEIESGMSASSCHGSKILSVDNGNVVHVDAPSLITFDDTTPPRRRRAVHHAVCNWCQVRMCTLDEDNFQT